MNNVWTPLSQQPQKQVFVRGRKVYSLENIDKEIPVCWDDSVISKNFTRKGFQRDFQGSSMELVYITYHYPSPRKKPPFHMEFLSCSPKKK